MTLVEKVNQQVEDLGALKKLWTSLMPDAPVPHNQQFITWLNLHTPEVLLATIQKTANKFVTLDGKMDEDFLVRYTSSVANNKTHKQEPHNNPTTKRSSAPLTPSYDARQR